MSKFLKVMITLAVIAVMASPAMSAEIKLNGYYRLQGTMESQNTVKNTDTTRAWADQRLRMKVTDKLNDNITVVYYGEYDAPFGVTGGKTVAGGGGQLSADGVGIETKNFYVDFKVPNTTWAVRTGIQGFGFGQYESFVTHDDMNGISARGMAGPLKITAGYFKWTENAYDKSDDINYYHLNGEMKVNDQVKFGLTAALVSNDSAAAKNGTAALTDDYYYGAYGSYTMDKFGFAGSLLFRNASGQDSSATDGDAFMLNLYAKAKLATGNIKVHGIYIPADDSTGGTDRFSANQSGWELHADNLMIFGTDIYYNNGLQGGKALDSAYGGYGLMGLTVSGDYKLPAAAYLKYGAGYFMTADKSPKSTTAALGSDLGFEVATQIGKKFAEKYDLSLRGAYGFMGDFYKTTAGSPEDTYKVVAMLNVSF